MKIAEGAPCCYNYPDEDRRKGFLQTGGYQDRDGLNWSIHEGVEGGEPWSSSRGPNLGSYKPV